MTDEGSVRAGADRLAVALMVLAALGSVPLLLWYGRDQWFALDEWDLLVNRGASNVHDLFAPYNGHWSTIPVLAYHLNFQLWGIKSYVPYQLLVVLVHVALTVGLWLVMRHLGVRAWIATGVAVPYLLFGTGYENIIWAFQIGFAGAAMCGVMQLVLADHDGPIRGRDWLGLAIGLVGLMCASAAVALSIAVGVAVLLRRGWRVALFHVGPPALAFGVWFIAIGHTSPQPKRYTTQAARFAREMVRGTFMGLGKYAAVAALLGVLAVIGVVAGVVVPACRRSRRMAALPTGLLVGFAVYLVLTAVTRSALGVASAYSSRYLHMAAAFVLPFIALGGETLARRRAVLAVAPIVLLAIAVPRNLYAFEHRGVFTLGREDIIAVAPQSRFFFSAPGRLRYTQPSLVPTLAPTVRWLRAANASGRLPHIAHPPSSLVLTADGILALEHRKTATTRACRTLPQAADVHLERGGAVRFSQPVDVVVVHGTSSSGGFRFEPSDGRVLVDVAGSIELRVMTAAGPPSRLCAAAPRAEP